MPVGHSPDRGRGMEFSRWYPTGRPTGSGPAPPPAFPEPVSASSTTRLPGAWRGRSRMACCAGQGVKKSTTLKSRAVAGVALVWAFGPAFGPYFPQACASWRRCRKAPPCAPAAPEVHAAAKYVGAASTARCPARGAREAEVPAPGGPALSMAIPGKVRRLRAAHLRGDRVRGQPSTRVLADARAGRVRAILVWALGRLLDVWARSRTCSSSTASACP
jgi:hypothetical protein